MKRYTKELEDYVRKLIQEEHLTRAEINQRVTEELGISWTQAQTNSYLQNHHLPTQRRVKSRARPVWTDERVAFLRDNGLDRSTEELTRLISDHFGYQFSEEQVRAARRVYGAPSGRDTRFKPGQESYQKGRQLSSKQLEQMRPTMFKPGHIPANWVPVGTVRKNTDGYWIVKTSDTGLQREKWRFVHRLIWEELHGPILKGQYVTFLDGNKDNLDPDNLVLISRQEHLCMTRNGLRSDNPQITQNGVYIARLLTKIAEKQKELYKKGEKENGD